MQLALLITVASGPHLGAVQREPLLQTSTYEVEQLIRERAAVHGANPDEVVRVAYCENRTLTPGRIGFNGNTIGIAQWLRGRGNHWDRSPQYRIERLDIWELYLTHDPDALYHDVDAMAWSFGAQALSMYPNNRQGWTCY